MQVGNGGTSGTVTDDSETLRQGNLESESIRGTCGSPDRDNVSKNGSNK